MADGGKTRQGHRNILLLVADDLGRDQVSCYGKPDVQTPNLDSLASSGSRFDKAFASTASCSGSRTVIYTGLHTHETGSYGLTHGVNGFQTFGNVETMPMLFNSQGYRTGILGKVHVAPDEQYPWQHRHETESRDVAMIADKARDFIQKAQEQDVPFCLTIGYVDPHRRIGTRGGFGNENEEVQSSRLSKLSVGAQDVAIPDWVSDLPEVRDEFVEYYKSIHRLDQGVGMVLDALEATGVQDNTLVLFLSDNGPPFCNSKTTLFEPGVRLPFLMRVPGKHASVCNPNLVSYVDILPTFLAWAGLPDIKPSLKGSPKRNGRSLLDIADANDERPGWDHVFGSHTFHEITNFWPTRYMRDRQYKYHRNVCWKLDFPFAMDLYASRSWDAMRRARDESGKAMIGPRPVASYIRRPPEELFDLDADPLELSDLASDPKHQSVLTAMRDAVEKWQTETNDPWLWRDGVSVSRFVTNGYAREGLQIPNRFDMDPEDASGEALGAFVDLT